LPFQGGLFLLNEIPGRRRTPYPGLLCFGLSGRERAFCPQFLEQGGTPALPCQFRRLLFGLFDFLDVGKFFFLAVYTGIVDVANAAGVVFIDKFARVAQ
jgi:hypothetical protein